MYMTLHKAKGT